MSKLRGRWASGRRLAFCAAFVAAIAGALPAAEIGTGFQDRIYRDETGEHKYTVFVPAAYTPLEKWPLLLFLHGAGERGTDPRLPVVGGIGPQIKSRAETFPFIVVFPQCEDVDCRAAVGWRADGPDAQRALRIVDEVEQELSVDRNREVITGLSMGGFGAWSIAAATPSRWSAVVPVAGSGDASKAVSLVNTPVWAFHGVKDVSVPPGEDERVVNAVRAAGGRACFTLLPEVRHNILHVVYNDDALYEWMLNPQSEPRPESFIENAKRPPCLSAAGRDFDLPFIPGVEIPQAIFLQIDPETIGAIAETLPDLVPANALSAKGKNISESRSGLLGRFQITLSGIGYSGSLERVVVTPNDNGWITIAMGLRNITAEVASTQVRGTLISANAGRMDMIVGQQKPVWLTFDVRPVIVGRRVTFEIGSRQFRIPKDDFHVTTPEVTAKGLPFLRNRVSNAVSSQLVSGAYARKSEIEQRVLDAVPKLVQRLEQALEATLSSTRVLGTAPTPAIQPRFRMWPESLRVDHSGISLMLGIVIAQPGLYAEPRPVRSIEPEVVDLATVPTRRGLTLGFSSALIEGVTASVIDVGAAQMSANDIPLSEFAAFGEASAIAKAVPDLARYGDQLRIRTRLRAVEPVTLRRTTDRASADLESSGASPLGYEFKLPHVALTVDIKTSREQAEWLPCAQFDLSVTQELRACLQEPSFSQRTFGLKRSAPEQVTAEGRFAEGYRAVNGALHPEAIAALFRTAWNASERTNLLEAINVPDRAIGHANMRLADVANVGPFIAMRYVPAMTRITNGTSEPIAYQIRAPHSDWGGPYTLNPQQFHDFAVPYPLTLRSLVREQELIQPLPMGAHFVFGKDDEPAPPPNTTSLGDAGPLRN
jgi:poly(3-hydroxybutyrate) depolymerase